MFHISFQKCTWLINRTTQSLHDQAKAELGSKQRKSERERGEEKREKEWENESYSDKSKYEIEQRIYDS